MSSNVNNPEDDTSAAIGNEWKYFLNCNCIIHDSASVDIWHSQLNSAACPLSQVAIGGNLQGICIPTAKMLTHDAARGSPLILRFHKFSYRQLRRQLNFNLDLSAVIACITVAWCPDAITLIGFARIWHAAELNCSASGASWSLSIRSAVKLF